MKAQHGYPSHPDHQGAPFPPGYTNDPHVYPYGYPTASVNPQQPVLGPVVTTAHHNVVIVPQPTYKDYLGLSIMNLLLCCLPLGIVAIIFSCKTRDSVTRGDMSSAARDSRMAFIMNMVALGVGLAGHLVWIIYLIYVSVAGVRYVSSSYHYYG